MTMKLPHGQKRQIYELIKLALMEDLGDGDHTSLSCIPADRKGHMQLLAKDTGIIAGVQVALWVFESVDKNILTKVYIEDGQSVKHGDIVLEVEGSEQSLLRAERVVLNFMQRMSGIATKTHLYAKHISHTKCRLLDTRKTTPGLRALEKWAVRLGGGHNHRMGLYDMILLKDNHVDFAGGIQKAIELANRYIGETEKNLAIEIEVRNFDELAEVLKTGKVQRIMLDNFSVEDTRKAVQLIGGKFETESSGGIDFDNLAAYAQTGVTYLSVGALTHSVKSFDLSLKALK